MEINESALARFMRAMLPHLDERQRRLMVGAAAVMLGRGGRTKAAQLSGLSRPTVSKGANEIVAGVAVSDRQRAVGGGAKPVGVTQPGLLEALDALVGPGTRGTSPSPLRWTSKSTYEMARELTADGFTISAETVRRLLHQMGYRLQAPTPHRGGATPPDRNAQFEYLSSRVEDHLRVGEPMISVDTKQRELVGDFPNPGPKWQPKGESELVRAHDFVDPDRGEAIIADGIHDTGKRQDWVSVGDAPEAAGFAVSAIRRWWDHLGRHRFPAASRLLITADGDADASHIRAWKHHLAQLATDTGLETTVCHYPPGTSKWSRIEHRMFSFITIDRRGRSLTSIRTIIELIAAAATQTGLTIQAHHDPTQHLERVEISDAELAVIPLTRHDWHGDWNYTISPA